MRRFKRIITLSIALIACLMILFWLGSIIKCEHLTFCYGAQFETAYREHTMLRKPDYLKILDYTETSAIVYYVARGTGGDILLFERTSAQEEWEFVEWRTIWSKSGSASGFVWPYIR